MLEIQKFLKSFVNLEAGNRLLQQKFAVEVKQDLLTLGDETTEVVWIYNYTDKARGNIRLENEARGLILNGAGDIVSMGFSRFFRYDSCPSHRLLWEFTNVEQQYDGTQLGVYAYQDNYFIQTRYSACADEPLPQDPSTTYYDAAYEILSQKFPDDPFGIFRTHNENDKYTWVFEFISPKNVFVTPYTYTDLILLSAFNKEIPGEILPEYVDQFAGEYRFSQPAYKRVGNIREATEVLERIDPLEEGLVIVDHRLHRAKLPNPAYTALKQVLTLNPSDLRPRHFAELVLKSDPEKIANYYPQFGGILHFLQEVIDDLMEELQTIWMLYSIADTKSVFAEEVKNHPFSHLLFMAWEGKIKDMSDALKYIKPKQLVGLATIYHETQLQTAFDRAKTASAKGYDTRFYEPVERGKAKKEASEYAV